jgi:hypothetical protein
LLLSKGDFAVINKLFSLSAVRPTPVINPSQDNLNPVEAGDTFLRFGKAKANDSKIPSEAAIKWGQNHQYLQSSSGSHVKLIIPGVQRPIPFSRSKKFLPWTAARQLAAALNLNQNNLLPVLRSK